MKTSPIIIFILLTVSFCFSCKRQPTILQEQAYFDTLMNEHPEKALKKLEQLKAGKYSHASEAEQMKLDLMIAKAGDKAFIPKTTDSITRKLVEFYEKHGTRNEQMEAYFYHGSAFRDMYDTPKALKYYLKAIDVADTCETNFNWYQYSIILEQLAGIYNLQHDNQGAINCHKQILHITEKQYFDSKIHDLNLLARYYNCEDSIEEALKYSQLALYEVENKGMTSQYFPTIGEILGLYAQRKQYKQAEKCYELLKDYNLNELPPNTRAAIGDYMMMKGKYNEALLYNASADSCFTDIFQKKSVKRCMYEIQKKLGDDKKILKYAEDYIQYSDSAKEAEKLEQAQQTKNAYIYHKDELHELELERKAEKRIKIIWMVIALASMGSIIGLMFHRIHIKRKNKEISLKEQTIEELEEEKIRMEEQLRQIETKLAHKKKMALSVSDVKSLFVDENENAKETTQESDWTSLFETIDAIDPAFINHVHTIYPDLNDFDKKMLCLMKVNIKKIQIADILHRSRSVITQHCAKLKDDHGIDVDTALGTIFKG